MQWFLVRRSTLTDDINKNLQDEIDWKTIDQIHEATLRISNECFEYKKLCVAVLAAVAALMIKLGNGLSDKSVFVVCLIVCIGFWLSDATAYFYQRKLRAAMDNRITMLAERNKVSYDRPITSRSILASAFNPSMILYYVLIITILALWFISYSSEKTQ